LLRNKNNITLRLIGITARINKSQTVSDDCVNKNVLRGALKQRRMDDCDKFAPGDVTDRGE